MPTDPTLIKAARALLGISQAELAEKANVGTRTLWKIEAGDRSISVENYDAVTRALEQAGIVFLGRTQTEGTGVRMTLELQSLKDGMTGKRSRTRGGRDQGTNGGTDDTPTNSI